MADPNPQNNQQNDSFNINRNAQPQTPIQSNPEPLNTGNGTVSAEPQTTEAIPVQQPTDQPHEIKLPELNPNTEAPAATPVETPVAAPQAPAEVASPVTESTPPPEAPATAPQAPAEVASPVTESTPPPEAPVQEEKNIDELNKQLESELDQVDKPAEEPELDNPLKKYMIPGAIAVGILVIALVYVFWPSGETAPEELPPTENPALEETNSLNDSSDAEMDRLDNIVNELEETYGPESEESIDQPETNPLDSMEADPSPTEISPTTEEPATEEPATETPKKVSR